MKGFTISTVKENNYEARIEARFSNLLDIDDRSDTFVLVKILRPDYIASDLAWEAILYRICLNFDIDNVLKTDFGDGHGPIYSGDN